jgi:hypothetical protein
VKLASAENVVEAQGVVRKMEFTIKASPKAFAMLSSGIYENKEAAPIRELATNALDSHISAGCADKPFKVCLPNELQPEFRIRDYGNGLSFQQMFGNDQTGETGIYNTYMDSDKSASNAYTGCFGIGSKSPWAYTDGFNVTSYHNGTKYMFACIMNERGIPEINYFGESPTDEPSGLEVSFAVKQQDISRFVSESKEIFRFFKVKPEIEGCEGWAANTPEYSFKFDGFGIRKNGVGSAIAIMGSVGYKINPGKFSDPYLSLLRLPIDMSFEIGDIDMTASREGLEYNPRVMAAIKAKADAAIEELSKLLLSKLAKAKTKWEQMLLYSSIKTEFSSILEVLRVSNKTKDIKTVIKVSDVLGLGGNLYMIQPSGSMRRKVTEIHPDPRLVFILESPTSPVGNLSKAMHYAEVHKCPVVLLKNTALVPSFIDNYGLPVKDIDTLPNRPKAKRNGGPVDWFSASRCNYMYSYKASIGPRNTMRIADLVAKKTKCYFVVATRSDIDCEYYQNSKVLTAPRDIPKIYGASQEFVRNVSYTELYFINKSMVARLKKALGANYVDYVELCATTAKDLITNKNLCYSSNNEQSTKLIDLANFIKRNDPTLCADLLTFADKCSTLIKSPTSDQQTFLNVFGVKIPTDTSMAQDITTLWDKYQPAISTAGYMFNQHHTKFYITAIKNQF